MNAQLKKDLIEQSILENEGLALACSIDGDELTAEYHLCKNSNLKGQREFLEELE